jgi:hypothetical protein
MEVLMSERTPDQDAANLAHLQGLSGAGNLQTSTAVIDPHVVAARATTAGVIDPKSVAFAARTGRDPQELKAALSYPPPDPNRVKTVGEEQLERSEAMMRAGSVHDWMAKQDMRDPADRPRAVEGVGFTPAPGQGSPSLYPENWSTMNEDERAAFEAAHPIYVIDPHKVAATPAHS